jgi:hypothetical protein
MEGVLSMFRGPNNSNDGLIWAVATATAAGATNLTLSLPSGAIGTPVKLKVAGTVGATVVMQISNSQQVVALVNPNAPPTEEIIPARAFPGKTNSVNVTATLAAAGNVYVSVAFKP